MFYVCMYVCVLYAYILRFTDLEVTKIHLVQFHLKTKATMEPH